MTKHAATCKNMANSHEREDVEEKTTALGSDARTRRKLTGRHQMPKASGTLQEL